MKRDRTSNFPKENSVTVSIYCTGYEQDVDFKCIQSEADRITNSFLNDKFIKVVDGGETTYFNVNNIIRITVE